MPFHSPTRIGYAGGRSGGDANIWNVIIPTGSRVGDVAIVVFFGMSATVRVNLPAGWLEPISPVVDNSRTMQVFARRIEEADLAGGTWSFTMTAGNGVTWSTMTIRNAVDPEDLVFGPVWTRTAASASTVSAPAVGVTRAGSLVLGLMAEASAGVETDAQVVPTGASKWFFQPHQTSITHTHLVTYVDNAALGNTSTVNATYPEGSASNTAVGLQVAIPGSEVLPDPDPASLFAGCYSFTATSLLMGARVANVAGQVRVDATPVDGGLTIQSNLLRTPDEYGWVSARVGSLSPNTRYNLAMVDITTGITLATIQATTTGGIRDDFKALTSSCQRSDWDAVAYNDMAAEGAAFYVHQGDLHYQDADTEIDWRFGLNSNMIKPAMKAFMASVPMTYRWDNHDWGGNTSWRESPPKNYAPQAIRNLMGADSFADDTGIYRTWTHNGVRFIDTDQWTLRDEAVQTPHTNFEPGKTMWGVKQREWLFGVLEAAQEPLIVWFTSFPLYGNWVSNGRWGNFRDEAAIVESWFGAHPDIHARIVAVGGDSHNIKADDGENTMWGLPSLNASPVGREGDVDSQEDGPDEWWNIANDPVTATGATLAHGAWSLMEFEWNEARTAVTFTWRAKRTGGDVLATWSRTFADIPTSTTQGVSMMVNGSEQPVSMTVLHAGVEVPATVSQYGTA